MIFSKLPTIPSKHREGLIFRLLNSFAFLSLVTLTHFIEKLADGEYCSSFLIFLSFLVLLSAGLIFLLRKRSIIHEIFVPIVFALIVILSDFFFTSKLENSQEKTLVFLYLIFIAFILSEKISLISNIFCLGFLIIFYTFKSLELESDPENVICNLLLLLTQTVNLLITKRKKPAEPEKKHSDQDQMLHVLNRVFPGLVFVFRNTFPSKNENEALEICFTNTKAQDFYISDLPSLTSFLEEAIFLKDFNPNAKNDGSLYSMTVKKSFKDAIFSSLNKILEGQGLDNNLDRHLVGYHIQRQKKIQVFLTGILRNNELQALMFVEDNQCEEDYTALKELDERKDKMLIAITHDLRSPLNGILAFINLAKSEQSPENRNEKLELAQINGNLLMSLIEDILDFQSIAQNKFSLKGEEFSLSSVLEETIDLITHQIKQKSLNFQLRTNISSLSPPILLFSDPRRLKQILLNLLTNSIKFTISGGKICLNVYYTLMPNVIKFEIIDSGIGIRPEIIEKLGQPFNTFDTNGLNKYGIGFGLYLSRRLAELLGPKEKNFHISSLYGKGSKIGFLIYQKLHELDKQTISYKRICFQQLSECSLTSNRLNSDLEKMKKTVSKSSKDGPNSNSKSDLMRKGGRISKAAFSLKDFENDHFPNGKPWTEANILRGISVEKNDLNKSCLKALHNSSLVNHESFDNLIPLSVTKKVSFGISKQMSMVGGSIIRRGKVSSEETPRQKLLFEEGIEFSPFSEDDFQRNFCDEINEDEEFSDECFLRNVGLIPKYSFEAKASIRRLNNNLSESSIILKRPKMCFSGSLESPTRSFNNNMDALLIPHICNILIVDDNTFNLLVLYEFLRKIPGFELNIEKATNGAECVKMFKAKNSVYSHNNYSIIFMDCYMPIMDGFQASAEIKRLVHEEKYIESRIIAVTGLSGLDEENKCSENGMDDFIMKPVSEKELTEVFVFYMRNWMQEGSV